MSKQLPARPSLEHLKKQAKDLLSALEKADPATVETVARYFPSQHAIGLNDAQLVVAREYGFESWAKLKAHLDTPVWRQFFDAVEARHIEAARELWRDHRAEIRKELVCALRAGDLEEVRRAVEADPAIVNENLAPHDQPPLLYLSFSPLLKVTEFEPGLLETARYLLDHGADPNGSATRDWGTETVLFGAAAVMGHAGLTKMLVEAGANPSDRESVFHAGEHLGPNECLRILLEAGVEKEDLNRSFRRKLDYEDEEGARLFLDNGADPNVANARTALSYAISRGRSIPILRLLLERGADPNGRDQDGTSPYAMARRIGYREAAELLVAHGANTDLRPEDAVLASAIEGDGARLAAQYPDAVRKLFNPPPQAEPGLTADSPQTVFEMACLGHVDAVRALLDLGMGPDKVSQWNETPLHWACVAARPEVVRLLLDRGASTEIRESSFDSDALGWALWGSEYWNGEHGDYAETVRIMLAGGAKRPDPIGVGSPEVRAVLAT